MRAYIHNMHIYIYTYIFTYIYTCRYLPICTTPKARCTIMSCTYCSMKCNAMKYLQYSVAAYNANREEYRFRVWNVIDKHISAYKYRPTYTYVHVHLYVETECATFNMFVLRCIICVCVCAYTDMTKGIAANARCTAIGTTLNASCNPFCNLVLGDCQKLMLCDA